MTNPAAMFIDIGASSKEEAEKKVSLGDVAVYAPDFFELGDDLVAAPAMDDRVGCCVLIGILKSLKNRSNEIVAVFTTQEEVGPPRRSRRGIRTSIPISESRWTSHSRQTRQRDTSSQ
jgi:putative aminopeptidase FrvX